MLQQPHGKLCQKYVDATKQNALSRRVSGLSGGAGPASPGAIGGGSMVHRLGASSTGGAAAVADGGGSGD